MISDREKGLANKLHAEIEEANETAKELESFGWTVTGFSRMDRMWGRTGDKYLPMLEISISKHTTENL